MAHVSVKPFWFRVARNIEKPPIPGQCHYVFPNGRTRCGCAVSKLHGGGKWCWAHKKAKPNGDRCAGPRPKTRWRRTEASKARERNRRVRNKQDERVLKHLVDAAQAISPCPDDSSVHPDFVELASEFRAEHKRWPLWWEMAKAIQDHARGKR